MSINFFFLEQNFCYNNILQQKELNKNYYDKYYVRSNFKKDQSVFLENNNKFSYISYTNPRPWYISAVEFKSEDNLMEGSSKLLKPFFFKQKKQDYFKFNLFLSRFNESKIDSIKTLLFNLTNLTLDNSNKSLLLLRSIKGGFRCYSTGTIGFLPRRQGLGLLYKTFLSLVKENNTKILLGNFYLLFSKNHLFRLYFLLRLPFKFISAVISPRRSRKRFAISSKRRQKRRRRNNDLNCVFLMIKTPHSSFSKKKVLANAFFDESNSFTHLDSLKKKRSWQSKIKMLSNEKN